MAFNASTAAVLAPKADLAGSNSVIVQPRETLEKANLIELHASVDRIRRPRIDFAIARHRTSGDRLGAR